MTAHAITKALGGHWHGSYGTAGCPAHDDKSPSLSISEQDGKLLVKCHAGCDQQDVWAALQDRGLVPSRERGSAVVDHAKRSHKSVANHIQDIDAKIAHARRIWADSKPARGTPVEVYLGGRDISTEPPPTLRYHPGLKHGPTGLFLPAMVAAVTTWPSRDIVAIHRTFLMADGRDKAPVSQNKMMLGPCSGGAVRLSQAGEELVLAEGIETALSVLQATEKSVWACLSTSGLKAVILPPVTRTVVIAADGDEAGEKAAQEAARRFYLEGREVKIARPPKGLDFNDLLMKPANVIPFPREAVHG